MPSEENPGSARLFLGTLSRGRQTTEISLETSEMTIPIETSVAKSIF